MNSNVKDPVSGTLDVVPGRFNLITYLENYNDCALMDDLGINLPLDSNTAVPVIPENNSKLVELNGSDYVTLQPPVPQPGEDASIGQPQHYTFIDTEEIPSPSFQGNGDSSPVRNDSPVNSPINPQETILMSPADNTAPLVMNTNGTSNQQIFIIADSPIFQTPNIPFNVQTLSTQTATPLVAQPSLIPSVVPMECVDASGITASQSVDSPKPVTPSKKSSQPKPRSRRQRPKKPKKYEIKDELSDPYEEKKRLNAINAKKNRDKKKDKLKELGEKVDAVTKERDKLKKEVEELKRREKMLKEQLASRNYVSLQ